VPFTSAGNHKASRPGKSYRTRNHRGRSVLLFGVIQVKPVYNLYMTVFRYGREYFEEGEYVRRVDAMPGDDLDPVVRIVEDLGTVEIPCGKVDCRSNCLEYMVRPAGRRDDYTLAECKISALVNII
jgi:hypothetical protein